MDGLLEYLRALSDARSKRAPDRIVEDLIAQIDQQPPPLDLESLLLLQKEAIRLLKGSKAALANGILRVLQHIFCKAPRLVLQHLEELFPQGQKGNTLYIPDFLFSIFKEQPGLRDAVLARVDGMIRSSDYDLQTSALFFYETCLYEARNWNPFSIQPRELDILLNSPLLIRRISKLLHERCDDRLFRFFTGWCERSSDYLHIHRNLLKALRGAQGAARLQTLQRFFRGTPWFVEDRVVDAIREFVSESYGREYIEGMQAIMDCSPQFATVCLPRILELLGDPAQGVQEGTLKLAKSFISNVSRFMVEMGNNTDHTDAFRTFEEYRSLMIHVPQYLSEAGWDALLHYTSSIKPDLQFIALEILGAVVKGCSTQLIPALAERLQPLAIRAPPPARCSAIATLATIFDRNLHLIDRTVVQTLLRVLQEEVSAEEMNLLQDFVDQHRAFLSWFGQGLIPKVVRSRHMICLGLFERVIVPKILQILDPAGIRTCLQFLVSNDQQLREHAFRIYQMLHEASLPKFPPIPDLIPPILTATTCPDCNAPLIEGVVRGPSYPADLTFRTWANLSVENLIQRITLFCHTCHKPVPLACLSADSREYWVERYIIAIRTDVVNAYQNMTALKVTVAHPETLAFATKIAMEWLALLGPGPRQPHRNPREPTWRNVLRSPELFGLALSCGHCGNSITFKRGARIPFVEYTAATKILQCLHCGDLNQLLPPEGILPPPSGHSWGEGNLSDY